MDDYLKVNMTIKHSNFNDSFTGYAGKRSINAFISYETSCELETAEDIGGVAQAIKANTDENRKLKYTNFKDNIDTASFISNSIAYLLRDAIENRIPGVFLSIELPDDVHMTQQVIDRIGSWYAVDPVFKGLEFHTKGGATSG